MDLPGSRERETFIPTRQTLLERLKDLDDSSTWREFFDTYARLIYSVAIKAGLSDAEAQEVVQETVIGVSKNIQGFQYDPSIGSFKSWLLTLARWRIQDQFRKRADAQRVMNPHSRQAEEGRRTSTVEKIPDPNHRDLDDLWEEEWRSNLLDRAMQEVKERVDPRHFQVFYFHVVKQQPVQAVGRMFGMNRGKIYLIKHRISVLLKRQVERLQRKAS